MNPRKAGQEGKCMQLVNRIPKKDLSHSKTPKKFLVLFTPIDWQMLVGLPSLSEMRMYYLVG
jgi:hypothetical protein